jgi:LPXTG-site transpeptidase (sortase) family protein
MDLRINWQALALGPRSNSFLRWTRNASFVIGVLALSCAGFSLLDARLYQYYLAWQFQQALIQKGAESPVDGDDPLHASVSPKALAEANHALGESPGTTVREGSPLGRIEIPRIGVAAMILEGIKDRTLRLAVGHIPGTPLPGQRGNVALAGHRDTFFRALRNIRKDDEITLTTLAGYYRYEVDSTSVVEPEETQVLDNVNGDYLTLVTCYPFSFVGSAPRRFIVRARRIPE